MSESMIQAIRGTLSPMTSAVLPARPAAAADEPRDVAALSCAAPPARKADEPARAATANPPLAQPLPGTILSRPRPAVPRTLLAETPTSLLPVPDTRQATTYSCGASALQAVLMYWGIEYVETELMERLHTDPQNGTNPRDIVRVAQEEGLEAQLADNQTLEDLKSSLDRGCPVIIACQAWRDGDDLQKPWSDVWQSGHYMVVIGMDDQNVWFEDPSLLGSRGVIPRAEFEERWHDVDDRPYVRSAIYIRGDQPKPPPSVVHVD